jgi:hypothetical protein
MTEPEGEMLPAVPDVAILRLRPGDFLVVTMHDPLSEHAYSEIARGLKERFPDNPALLLEGATLSVLRKEG